MTQNHSYMFRLLIVAIFKMHKYILKDIYIYIYTALEHSSVNC